MVGTAPHSVDTYVAKTKTYFYTEFLASNDLLLFGITYHSADSPKLECSSVAVTKKASTLFLVYNSSSTVYQIASSKAARGMATSTVLPILALSWRGHQ